VNPASHASTSRLIFTADLLNGDALSFTDQPFLADLVENIRADEPLTLLVGAGVSMEAGLPSWKELVERLIASVDDDDLKYFVSKADIDIMRKAGVTVALLKRNGPVDMKLLVRQALFPTGQIFQPGPLAQAIARLAVLRETEVRIITTNYDTILEKAIEHYKQDIKHYKCHPVESFALEEIGEWKRCNRERIPAVLHVHGLIGQDGLAKDPIVLTESEFLQSGASVRQVIAESLKDSMALLLGLSITDPNLIGPLFETKDKPLRSGRYSLSITGKVVSESEDPTNAAKYHVEAARYLLNLDLKPILLRSYSQLNQVVSDLGLAITEPDLYSTDAPEEQSLIYGIRFERSLSALYDRIGCNKEPFIPTGEAAGQITQRLRDALAAPQAFLDEKNREYATALIPEEEEHFQLCLWLRRQDRANSPPSYSLELVGSSTFQSYEPWALQCNVDIKYNSTYAAAQAVYRGITVSTNLEPQNNAGIWKGVLAIPIRLGGSNITTVLGGDALDQLTVGALTIDSTRFVAPKNSNNEDVPIKEQGIIARLRKADTETLIELLYKAVPCVLALSP
jgi:SIR2-like domain